MTPPRTGTLAVATLGPSGTGALLGVGFAVEGDGDAAGAELLAGAEDGDAAGGAQDGAPRRRGGVGGGDRAIRHTASVAGPTQVGSAGTVLDTAVESLAS